MRPGICPRRAGGAVYAASGVEVVPQNTLLHDWQPPGGGHSSGQSALATAGPQCLSRPRGVPRSPCGHHAGGRPRQFQSLSPWCLRHTCPPDTRRRTRWPPERSARARGVRHMTATRRRRRRSPEVYARDRIVPRPRRESHRRLSNGEPLEQYQGDRYCRYEGCTVKLSRYNPSDCCGLHKGWVDTVTRSYG